VEDWYKWIPDNVLGGLGLTKFSLVYINFSKAASTTVVEYKFFDSYLKMDKILTSNLMKKIDGGKSNIKMN